MLLDIFYHNKLQLNKIFFADFHIKYIRDAVKTSYSLTLSLKVGGGQIEIIFLGGAKIDKMVRFRAGGSDLFVPISLANFGSILMAKMACLNKMRG